MSLSAARREAFRILLRVERDAAYAGELLRAPSVSALSPADRVLTQELTMGVLRWRIALDAELEAASGKSLARFDIEVATALRLGLHQLRHLDRVPPRAAVDQSVELVKHARKRSAAALVNAVLRRLSQNKLAPKAGEDAAALALAYAHPQWLVEGWLAAYGATATRAILEADQRPPHSALRLDDAQAERSLREEGLALEPGAVLRSARRALSPIIGARAFVEGLVAYQDEASQLAAHLAGRGRRILDACAAPGGKTMVLAANNPQSRIVACELHESRARQLAERLRARPNIETICADASTLVDAEGFDLVLADLPCSGTGTLARNPEIKLRLRPEDLADIVGRQQAILRNASRLLRPGGRLLLSTCSLEPAEGPQLLDWLLAQDAGLQAEAMSALLDGLRAEGELLCEPQSLGLVGRHLTILPGLAPCDGFFAAAVRRAL